MDSKWGGVLQPDSGQGSAPQGGATQYQQQAPSPGGAPAARPAPGSGGSSRRGIAIAVVVVAVIAAALFVVMNHPAETTTSSTTTLNQATASAISGCSVISKPGSYYLAGNINYTQTAGACIEITADNVVLDGKGYKITGSGPFTDLAPFSYGILFNGVSNVSVSGVIVSRFSYDAFMNATSGSLIYGSNFTNSTLSGLYLLDSYNNTLSGDRVYVSQSEQGGIHVASGSGNSFQHDVVSGNAYYGLVLNAGGNSFNNDVFSSNPVDLVCNASSAQIAAGTFANSTCSVNNNCGFASCTTNIPFNFSSVHLTPGPVAECGTIYVPGTYALAQGLSTAPYAGRQLALNGSVACIRILAPNVNLDCSGMQISNSSYGIYVGQVPNVSISDCILRNDSYGVYLSGSFAPDINNSTFYNNTYGLFLNGSSAGGVSGIRLLDNEFGMFINSSPGTLFTNIDARNNTYGVYLSSGYGEVFNGGSATGSSKSDLYCSPATYNSTTDLAQGISCGITSCAWASSTCSQTVLPNLAVYPITSCQAITKPGAYSVSENLLAKNTCLAVSANNVSIECKGFSISGSGFGSAFLLNGVSNVSITGCSLSNFAFGVNASDSSHLTLSSVSVSGSSSGLRFSNVSESLLTTLSVSRPSSYGFNFTGLSGSSVVNSSVSAGSSGAYGFSFTGAHNNNIAFDSATGNPGYGFYFKDSHNNSVYNNSAFSNTGGDYVCSGTSEGLYSNPIGIDSGNTKNGCEWLVELNPLVSGPSCTSFFSPGSMVFNRDMLFTSGDICFNIYSSSVGSANTTNINCAGHTVYAENGGTFAFISNASSVRIHNCLLLNFTTGIQGNGQSTSVFNNTISYASNGLVLSGRFPDVYNNRIENSTNGIVLENTAEASVYSNLFFNNTIAMLLSNVSSSSIDNNTFQESGYGMLLANTTSSTLKSNMFLGSSAGDVYCNGTSVGSGSQNADSGGNICQMVSNCGWFGLSSTCK